MKSYQIHFIRHGATAANREGRYVGVTDTPLSQEGIGKLEDIGAIPILARRCFMSAH